MIIIIVITIVIILIIKLLLLPLELLFIVQVAEGHLIDVIPLFTVLFILIITIFGFLVGSLVGMVLVGLRAFAFIEFLIFVALFIVTIAIRLKLRHELALTEVGIIICLILAMEVVTGVRVAERGICTLHSYSNSNITLQLSLSMLLIWGFGVLGIARLSG